MKLKKKMIFGVGIGVVILIAFSVLSIFKGSPTSQISAKNVNFEGKEMISQELADKITPERMREIDEKLMNHFEPTQEEREIKREYLSLTAKEEEQAQGLNERKLTKREQGVLDRMTEYRRP